MKIEKLSDDKVRITLTYDDALEMDINLVELDPRSPGSELLFLDIIKKAEEKLDFTMQDSRLIIEAIPFHDDGFVMNITKIDEAEDVYDKLLAIKDQKRENLGQIVLPLIYCFEEIDHLYEGVKHISDSFRGNSSLYLYNDYYYLTLKPNYASNIMLCDGHLSEFGNKVENPLTFQGVLDEHGKLLVNDYAIEKLNIVTTN